MKQIGFGKGQSFADEACQPLTQSVELTLNVGGLSAILTRRLMSVCRKNALVGVPEITERMGSERKLLECAARVGDNWLHAGGHRRGHPIPGPYRRGGLSHRYS
jgi:hypothetical protein